MAWRIEVKESAQKGLRKLDKRVQLLIIRFLRDRVANAEDPRQVGKPLKGDKKDLWRYRLSDYRIICDIEDSIVTVLVLRIRHRKDVYR